MPFADPFPILRRLMTRHLRPPPKLSVAEWCDQHRRMLPPSPRPGPWRTDMMPHLREPMEDFANPGVRRIVIMFGTQCGKTECLINCAMYAADCRPVPIVWAMDSATNVRDFADERLIPAFLNSPKMKSHVPGVRWAIKKQRLILDTCVIALVGANSAGKLASRPAGLVICDEIDKWPQEMRGRGATEGSALELIRKRLDAFGEEGKDLCASTPSEEDVGIDHEYKHSDQGKYYVPCPRCGAYQLLRFGADGKGGVRWEGGVGKGAKDEEHVRLVERVVRTAWYECEACGGRIESHEKVPMLQEGKWVRFGQEITRDGVITGAPLVSSIRGYQMNSLYSPFMSFGAVAEGFVLRRGEPDRGWINSRLAEPWRVRGQRGDEDELIAAARADPPEGETRYSLGTVPPGCLVLTGAIDVQKDVVYVEVSGWGLAERRWVIAYAVIPCPFVGVDQNLPPADRDRLEEDAWAQVSDFCRSAFPIQGSKEAESVWWWGIDTGYRRVDVLRFCERMGPNFVPMKGQENQVAPLKEGPVENWEEFLDEPMDLLSFAANAWKTDALGRLKRKPPAMGSVRMPEDVGFDWCRQMTAEQMVQKKVRRGVHKWEWVKRPGRDDNHWWDTHVMNLALAERIGLKRFGQAELVRPGAPVVTGPRTVGRLGL